MQEIVRICLTAEPEPTVEDLTDEKQGKVAATITQNFKLQPNPNSCEPTCITNILHELSDRFKAPALRISEAKIDEAVGYKAPRGYTPSRVMPGMKRILNPLGWTALQESKVSYPKMRKIIHEKSWSYPLVSLSGEYMRDMLDYRTGVVDDHVVVVLRSAGDWTVVYDAYGRLSPRAKVKFRKFGPGIIPIRTPNFINYWTQTSIASKWVFWVAPLTKAEPLKPLESYNEPRKPVVTT